MLGCLHRYGMAVTVGPPKVARWARDMVFSPVPYLFKRQKPKKGEVWWYITSILQNTY